MSAILLPLQLLLVATLLVVCTAVILRRPPFTKLVALRSERRLLWLPLTIVTLVAALAEGVGVGVPFVVFFAGALSLLAALGLLCSTHLRGNPLRALLPLFIALAAVGTVFLQPLGLKVMLLPKADKLPYEPVAARVVKTYDEGVWFESVRAGSDGTLYLAANLGLDFTRGDYYRHAHGEVIARRPDGTERILFTTPEGSVAGVFAVAPNGTLYMSSNGVTPGIWRIPPDGSGAMLTKLPQGAWPNGLDFGPDGMLYTPDSALGLIWRVDPDTGRAEIALKDKLLSARPFVSLAPGANGLHFRDRTLIVTVSDSTKVLAYPMHLDGSFGAAEVIASGIPGDDFAIGPDGSLFITTHPYNTLVRVYPNGRRAIIADARQRIIGATDAVFGRGNHDRDVLYVATDGGAFTGGPKTRGQLVALTPAARDNVAGSSQGGK